MKIALPTYRFGRRNRATKNRPRFLRKVGAQRAVGHALEFDLLVKRHLAGLLPTVHRLPVQAARRCGVGLGPEVGDQVVIGHGLKIVNEYLRFVNAHLLLTQFNAP